MSERLGIWESVVAWQARSARANSRRVGALGRRLGAWAAPKCGKAAVGAWFLAVLALTLLLLPIEIFWSLASLAVAVPPAALLIVLGAALRPVSKGAADACLGAAKRWHDGRKVVWRVLRWCAGIATLEPLWAGAAEVAYRGLAWVLRLRPETAPGFAPLRWLGLSAFAMGASLKWREEVAEDAASGSEGADVLSYPYEFAQDWALARSAMAPVGLLGAAGFLDLPWKPAMSRVRAHWEKARAEGRELTGAHPEAKVWLDWMEARQQRAQMEAVAGKAPEGARSAAKRL